MKKWLGYYIGFILLLLAGTAKVEAQIDPTLAGMILGYTNKAEKELKKPRKGDADADNRTSLDAGRSGRHDRFATDIQQLS